MITYDTLAKIAEFEALIVHMTIDPLGVDPTLESVAELYARWRELRRLGFDIDPAVEQYLDRVMGSTQALKAEDAPELIGGSA